MKLKDLVKTGRSQQHDHDLMFIDGVVEADFDTDYIRLYTRPSHRRSYALIAKEFIQSDLHAWTKEEMSNAGFVGVQLHRIWLKVGTPIQIVSVRVERLGESVEGNRPANANKVQSPGECHHAPGCPASCCTDGSDDQCYCDSCCIG